MPSVNHSSVTVPAVALDRYSFSYAGTSKKVLDGVSFSLPQCSFAVLGGVSGSGKSTLLRALKPELAVAGISTGTVCVMGHDVSQLATVDSARMVGFVQQDPENQLVTDKVWHELAFGLENLGVERSALRRRVAETAHFFGIGGWFERSVKDLSGGQKQLLNLAAVVVMQPQLLVLDEPTSQLDPIAAKDFFDVLGRVNAELGVTVVIIEHRLEDVLPMADRMLFLSPQGALEFDGSPDEFIRRTIAQGSGFVNALPAATRIACVAGAVPEHAPVTVRQGRDYLAQLVGAGEQALPGGIPTGEGLAGEALPGEALPGEAAPDESPAGQAPSAEVPLGQARPQQAPGNKTSPQSPDASGGPVLLEARDVWFRYTKHDPFVLRGVDFEVRKGDLAAIVGGNGSGKSTLLSALAGVRKPERGRVKSPNGTHVALLSQDPKTMFVCDTLFEDLMEWSEYAGYGEAEVRAMVERFGLEGLEERHPYDLSGGEMQKAAIAKVLLLDPDVLLLDEPVKGTDAVARRRIGEVFKQLAAEGKAVVFTAHDLEFVAEVACTCSMMFGCEITCTQDCHSFFVDNLFYSTATSRITHGILDGCVTVADVARALGRSEAGEPAAARGLA